MTLQMLDVLIGLVTVYVIFSTVASALCELIEAWLKKRGKLLEQGIGEIFEQIADGGDRDELLKQFYGDASIFSLFRGRYKKGGGNLPSYISPERFADTLFTLAQAAPKFRAICDAILKRAGNGGERHIEQLAAMATANLKEFDATVDHYKQQIADYYQENMTRVAGWFRRHVQKVLFCIGMGIAVIFNVDTLSIVRTLSSDPQLRNRLVAEAISKQTPAPEPGLAGAPCDDACEKALEETIRINLDLARQTGLPIGWVRTQLVTPRDFGDFFTLRVAGYWFGKLFGWIVTALAICQGAPFWFDLLNKLTNLRSTVAAPSKKPDDERTPKK